MEEIRKEIRDTIRSAEEFSAHSIERVSRHTSELYSESKAEAVKHIEERQAKAEGLSLFYEDKNYPKLSAATHTVSETYKRILQILEKERG